MTLPTARSQLTYPPLDYSVTLAEVTDFHIKHNPSATIYTFAQEGKPTYSNVSFLEFGRAVHRAAHYIRPMKNGPGRQTIAFVALADSLLYQAVMLGIIRAGHIPYPMSPRNTAVAIIKLMKDTACHRLLTTQQTLKSLVDDIRTQLTSSDPHYDLHIEEVPPVFAIFPKLGEEQLNDPFEEYFDVQRPPLTDVIMYLHSSGSTGLPKTVPQTFKTMVDWACLPSVTDFIHHPISLKLSAHGLPAFHTLGIITQVHSPLYSMVPIGLFPPTAVEPHLLPMIPTPHNLLDHISRTECNCLTTIPTLLQIWGQDQKAVSFLATLQFAAYSGGSLPPKLGNFMTQSGVHVRPIYGATEFGAPTHAIPHEDDQNDWEYVKFSNRSTVRWHPQGDGTYEAQILSTDAHQVSVENLPDIKGYATSDLFLPHPTKKDYWKIVGRADDVLIHTSGEKTVPAPMEGILMSSPYVSAAIIFGRERDQPGVLIELESSYQIDVQQESAVIEKRNMLWSIVEEANKVAPGFSRIYKEMILISSKDKPLPRAGKGTVMRKAALHEYRDEIDAIYAQVEATVNIEAVTPPQSWDVRDLEDWLSSQISEILSKTLGSRTEDLFEHGMDSLSATILRRRIVGAMQTANIQQAGQVVSHSTIYEHSSIEKLAEYISGVVKDPEGYVLNTDKTSAIEAMIQKYSSGLRTPISGVNTPDKSMVVLLTGSTGNLGSQILEALLRDMAVTTVYVFNRPSSKSESIQQRQMKRFADKGLDTSLLSSGRLVYLEGEASHNNLGLTDAVYEQLRTNITIVIHNAWRLDFNLSLSSFESNIQGTRNVVDLARSSAYGSSIKFLFTSSVSSAYSWDKAQGPYPEEVLKQAKFAVGSGYGESKYVAERILEASGLRATSFRIGQISGGLANGAWATTDWLPILVKSSIHMNAFPSANGIVSWIPMDFVSQTILDVARSPDFTVALNVVHPHPVTWKSIVSALNNSLVEEGVLQSPLPIVNIQLWVSKLRQHSTNTSPDIIASIPAIKLLDFFSTTAASDATFFESGGESNMEMGGLARFSTDKARSMSKTMRSLPPVAEGDAQRWVKYWKGVGFI